MRLARNISYHFSQYVKLSTYKAPFEQVAKLELDNPKLKNALSIDLLAEVYLSLFSSMKLSKKLTNNRLLELVF